MARDYALAPFAPENKNSEEEERNETWTASTTLYSLDLHCEAPRLELIHDSRWDRDEYYYVGINDCQWPFNLLENIGNYTIGSNSRHSNEEQYITKKFTPFYVGYYSTDNSDYYLESHCPKKANHTW
jgi:hypothetical protein